MQGIVAMPQAPAQSEQARMTENLRRTIELTELALALRAAVVRQQDPHCDPMKKVMHEIRLAKEQAWQQNPS
jgi:hypothetical protein